MVVVVGEVEEEGVGEEGVVGLVVLGFSLVVLEVSVVAVVVVVVHGGSNYPDVVDNVVALFFSPLYTQKRLSDCGQKSFSLDFLPPKTTTSSVALDSIIDWYI